MKILKGIFDKTDSNHKGIISIGFFDSFHIGHEKLLLELIKISNEKKLINYVLTYENIPQKTTNGKSVLELADKLMFIREIGINNLILCKFEKEFYSLKPELFIKTLKNNFNINEFVLTEDIHFGDKKSGNLQSIINEGGIVNIVKPEFVHNNKVSTTFIKKLIVEGDIGLANKLIGRNFYIRGIVKKGKQLGRKLGYPTMNIHNINVIYPKDGVYITKTIIKNHEYYSMTYLTKDIIESYLFNYNRFSYNFEIKVEFLSRIRDKIAFVNNDDLIQQISLDMKVFKAFIEKSQISFFINK